MINDPVTIISGDTFTREHFNRTTEPQFYAGRKYGNMTIGLVKALSISHWHIIYSKTRPSYFIRPAGDRSNSSLKDVNREQFFSILEQDFTDYFEWFLWHQNWHIEFDNG